MATFLMSQLVADARIAVQDLGVLATPRFADAQILSLANQTLKAMAVLRPDLFALVTTMTTVQGAYQTAPADSIRFMEALLVVGANNLNEINREALDLMSNNWQTLTPTTPTNWMRHPRNANAFFTYPPAAAGITLQIEYAQSPPFYALTQAPAIMPDAYYSTLLDGTVARLEMTDNEASNSGRAKLMNDMFVSQLQTSLQARNTLDNESGGGTDDIASPPGAVT